MGGSEADGRTSKRPDTVVFWGARETFGSMNGESGKEEREKKSDPFI